MLYDYKLDFVILLHYYYTMLYDRVSKGSQRLPQLPSKLPKTTRNGGVGVVVAPCELSFVSHCFSLLRGGVAVVEVAKS